MQDGFSFAIYSVHTAFPNAPTINLTRSHDQLPAHASKMKRARVLGGKAVGVTNGVNLHGPLALIRGRLSKGSGVLLRHPFHFKLSVNYNLQH